MRLEECLEQIFPVDAEAGKRVQEHLNALAKPLHGLGRLEDMLIQIGAVRRTEKFSIHKRALIVMCADNGVVEEGVTQTDSSVTTIVANNFARGMTSVCLMAKTAGVDVIPVDIGVKEDTVIRQEKIARGTKNMVKGPAMTREETVRAIETGIRLAEECAERGYEILLTGEMGIGNTTTSSAVTAVLLGKEPETVTGRGAGLSDEGLKRKYRAIKTAIERNAPNAEDPLDVLAKVGGLDIAGMTGVFLGGAALNLPVIIDGYISAAAALVAARLCPEVKGYMLSSHQSKEPGMKGILEELEQHPFLDCQMSLGEGTGAVSLIPLLDLAMSVYEGMETFAEVEIEAYEELGGRSECLQ
mgnify:FL=1